MKIKLDNFTATIDIESVELVGVYDVTKNKIASVDLLINGKYGTTLNGFTYSTTWEDAQVLEWANKELLNYTVK